MRRKYKAAKFIAYFQAFSNTYASVDTLRQLFSEALAVEEVTATGKLGEFGILPGHAPFLTSLKIGELVYKNNGVTEHMSLNWGYFEVSDDKIIVLVETAETAAEIDIERAKAALGRAIIRMQVAGKAVRK